MNRARLVVAFGFGLVEAFALPACQVDRTEAFVVNDLPADVGEPLTVYKVWYRSTLYLDPIAPGTRSDPQLVGAGAEHAFALLAVGYDPDAGALRLVPARTKTVVRADAGETSALVFSRATVFIGCGGPDGLSREDFETITTRIFPGDPIVAFDPSGCTPPPEAADAGHDAAADE